MDKETFRLRGIAKATLLAAIGSVILGADPSMAQKKYGPGVTDTEIKIGNILAYSGPLSVLSVIGKVEAAYFKKINEQGGINGRKINFISYDDAFSPPKTVEQARKLVEDDEVLLLFSTLGTPTNSAIHKYMNQKKVPHIFLASGGAKFADPQNFPWTMAWVTSYRSEARIYAKYILQNLPGKTVGILYQNDDFGKDYVAGFNDILGADRSKIVVAEAAYDVTSPTIDSQIAQIKAANPDILLNMTSPKFTALSIRKIGELGWRPLQFLSLGSLSISNVLKPAGLDNAQGIISATFQKDPLDPQWKDDADVNEYRAFMAKYYPDGSLGDPPTLLGYGAALGLVHVLEQCGDDLTRENVMKQMASLDFRMGMFLPGITIKTSPTDYSPMKQLQLVRFKGETWERLGSIIGAE